MPLLPQFAQPCPGVRRARRWLSALLLTLILVMPLSSAAQDQGAIVSSRRNWWELDRAYSCGRLWCSRVLSPAIPMVPGRPRITVAVRPNLEDKRDEAALRAEARSGAVARSLSDVSNNLAQQLDLNDFQRYRFDMGFWLLRGGKPRHPLTPSFTVAIQNNAMVIILPANSETNSPQVTMVTITKPDGQANGLDVEALSKQWKATLEATVSETLWGKTYDQLMPLGRWIGAAIAAMLGLLCVALLTHQGEKIYRRRRGIRSEIRMLRIQKNAELESDEDKEESRNEAIERLQRQQVRLNQINLTVKTMLIFRVAIAVSALIVILFLFPSRRFTAAFLMQQSVGLPTIWVAMVVLESLASWAVIRKMNSMALDAQAADPDSPRPRMRLETTTRVWRGSISTIFTLLGFYLTVLLFGITPEMLAGAGVVAVALGFLARGLVEDTLGGILVLLTDRYAIGDSVSLNGQGGLVENMNLLYTQLRGIEGELITLRNGMINESLNRSQGWARVNFDVDISWSADLERACEVLKQLGSKMAKDPDWSDLIMGMPELLGVDRIDHSGVRLKYWIQTLPLQQWSVGREYRRRVKEAFDREGIEPGVPQRVLKGAAPNPVQHM